MPPRLRAAANGGAWISVQWASSEKPGLWRPSFEIKPTEPDSAVGHVSVLFNYELGVGPANANTCGKRYRWPGTYSRVVSIECE